jgi:phage-related tail fiber protein
MRSTLFSISQAALLKSGDQAIEGTLTTRNLVPDATNRDVGAVNNRYNSVFAGTVDAGEVKGDGSGLSALSAANVTTGFLPDARLPDTGVTFGTYGTSTSIPVLQIDAKGRVTSASNQAVPTASTTQQGIVRLNDTVTSTSTTEAATANAVKLAYDTAVASGGGDTSGLVRLTGGTDQTIEGNIAIEGTLTTRNLVPDATNRVIGALNNRYDQVFARTVHADTGFVGVGSGLSALSAANVTTGFLPDARLPDTGVTFGTYGTSTSIPVLQIDAKGRVTSATNQGVPTASTTQQGIVKLNDTVTSTLNTEAATANAVKSANDLAASKVSKAGDTMTGTLTTRNLVPDATNRVIGALNNRYDQVFARTVHADTGFVGVGSGLSALSAANVTTGFLPDARLPDTGVTFGTYGTSTSIPVLTIDAKGRVTSATNQGVPTATVTQQGIVKLNDTVTSTLNTEAATANAVKSANDLAASKVSKAGDTMTGTLTTRNLVPDATNRVIGALNNRYDQVFARTVHADTGFVGVGSGLSALSAANVTTGFLPDARLPDTGVTFGTYGTSTSIPVLTIDAKGRVTSATNQGVPTATVTQQGIVKLNDTVTSTLNTEAATANAVKSANDLAASKVSKAGDTMTGTLTTRNLVPDATNRVIGALNNRYDQVFARTVHADTGFVGVGSGLSALSAANVTTGFLPDARLPDTGVTFGTYGTSTSIPVLTIDAKGRVTSATNQGVPTASTTQQGIVKLNDTVTSTLKTEAATANAVRSANINANGRVPSTRVINTAIGSGLSGGGTLTDDLTLTVDNSVVRTSGNQFIAGSLLPNPGSPYNLGADVYRWTEVWATRLYGDGTNITNVSASDNTKLPLSGGIMTGTLRSTFIIPTLNGSYTLGNQNFKYAESHTVKAFPDQLRVNTEDTGLAQCYVNGTTIIDITQPSFGGRSFGVASGFFPTGFPDYNFQVVPDVVFLGNQSGSVKPEPVDNNKTDIGVPSFRFRTIFLVNNPNVSSDINDKIDIQTLENDLGLSFINAIRPVQYRSNPRTNYIRAKKQIDYIEVSDKDKVFSSAPTLKLDPGGEAHVVLDETGRIQDIIIDKNYTIDHRSVFFAQFPEFPDFVLKVITRRCDECTTNDGSLAASRTSYGVIAQEIEAIRPSFHGVSKDTNETTGQVTYSFDYSSLVPCLIRAVQELTAKNASLEERIAAIEAHLGIA